MKDKKRKNQELHADVIDKAYKSFRFKTKRAIKNST